MKILYLILISISLTSESVIGQNAEIKLANGWYYIIEEKGGAQFKLDKTNEYYYLDTIPIIITKNIIEITFDKDRNGNAFLVLQFDSPGTKAWKYATMKSINRRLGFIFENKLIQAPKVNNEIEMGIAAIWDYNMDELTHIKSSLENERRNTH